MKSPWSVQWTHLKQAVKYAATLWSEEILICRQNFNVNPFLPLDSACYEEEVQNIMSEQE